MTNDEIHQIVVPAVHRVLASFPGIARQANDLAAAIGERLRAEPTVRCLYLSRAANGGAEIVDVEPSAARLVMPLPIAKWVGEVPAAIRDRQTAQ